MKVRDLDNNITVWSLHGYTVNGNNDRNIRSSFHLEARQLLKELYPTLTILEEVPIHLRRNQIAYLDFYLPLRKMAVEVQGEQHFKFIPHFHGTLAAFAKSRRRDTEKKEWAEINGITLIEFPWTESLQQWKDKLV